MEDWLEIGWTRSSTVLGIVFKIMSFKNKVGEKGSTTVVWYRYNHLKELSDSIVCLSSWSYWKNNMVLLQAKE